MGTKDNSHGRRTAPLNEVQIKRYDNAAKEIEDTLNVMRFDTSRVLRKHSPFSGSGQVSADSEGDEDTADSENN
jgi:hypothetical protein